MIKNNNLTKGIFCILISAFGFALMSFFVKLSGDLPVLQKAFFRNLIAGSIALIPVIKTNNLVRYPREKKDWIILFFRSIFGTIGLICNFFAVSHINLADASIIQRLSPFVIIILSYFIFKEKVTKKQILFIFLAFFGNEKSFSRIYCFFFFNIFLCFCCPLCNLSLCTNVIIPSINTDISWDNRSSRTVWSNLCI